MDIFMRKFITSFILITLIFIPQFSNGLELGEQSPEIAVADWVQGEETSLAESKGEKILVLYFWATYCPPCIKGIPELTEVQKKFKNDVNIIAITKESRARIIPFIKKMAGQMDFTVVSDDNDQTAMRYMGAIGERYIPYMFAISKEGDLVWHGRDKSTLEFVLDDLINNKGIQTVSYIKKQNLAKKYFKLKINEKNSAEANSIANEIFEMSKDDAQFLDAFSFTMVSSKMIKKPDYELALKFSEQAYKITEGKDFSVLDTLSMIHYKQNDLEQAIIYLKSAIANCKNDQALAYLEKNLRSMEAKQAK